MSRFENVVNKEFIDKYLPLIHESYKVIDKDGRIRFSVLEDVFYSMNGEEFPNRFIYSLIHGKQNLIPSWNLPKQFVDDEDRLYKVCLNKGKTWKEVLGHEESNDILL